MDIPSWFTFILPEIYLLEFPLVSINEHQKLTVFVHFEMSLYGIEMEIIDGTLIVEFPLSFILLKSLLW